MAIGRGPRLPLLSGFAPRNLQILDQRRDTPPLAQQLAELKAFALPRLEDLRLPNPVPLDLFDRAGFANAGQSAVQALT